MTAEASAVGGSPIRPSIPLCPRRLCSSSDRLLDGGDLLLDEIQLVTGLVELGLEILLVRVEARGVAARGVEGPVAERGVAERPALPRAGRDSCRRAPRRSRRCRSPDAVRSSLRLRQLRVQVGRTVVDDGNVREQRPPAAAGWRETRRRARARAGRTPRNGCRTRPRRGCPPSRPEPPGSGPRRRRRRSGSTDRPRRRRSRPTPQRSQVDGMNCIQPTAPA